MSGSPQPQASGELSTARRLGLWLASVRGPEAEHRAAARLRAEGRHQAAFRLDAGAARAGLPAAQYWIGRSYLEGTGVPPSPTEGSRWLAQAADAGHTEAQALLAAFYLRGVSGASAQGAPTDFLAPQAAPGEPDYEAALRWGARAAAAGSVAAQALVAHILTNGPAS